MKKIVICLLLCTIVRFVLAAPMMDSRVRKVPQDITDKIFVQPEEVIKQLVSYLTAGMSEPRPKVKVIHDWICDNIAYDTDIFENYKLVPRQTYDEVLKKRAAVCAGYANLFSIMCYYAKVECIPISGWSKGFGYRGYIDDDTDHAWNAVKIGGKWSLIDVTWDAGFVNYKTFVKNYSTQWFMKSGTQFIYSHLPEKDEYQFLTKLKTKEEFVAEPYIEPIFFERGLSLSDKMPYYNNEVTDDTTFEFKMSDSSVNLYTALIEKNGPAIEGGVWSERNGSKYSMICNVPNRKPHRVRLYVCDKKLQCIPIVINDETYRRSIIPQVMELLESDKITPEEADLLKQSYYSEPDTGSTNWFYREDLFDKVRINAVKKVLNMTDNGLDDIEEVLSFNISAAEGYDGYGDDIWKFPLPYAQYRGIKNLHIISPQSGSLKKGSTVKFAVESRDFTGFGYAIDRNGVTRFNKTDKKNVYEIEITIPDEGEIIDIYGTHDGKGYFSYWYYQICD